MKINLFIILILIFCINSNSFAEDSDLAKLFQNRGLDGTIIINSLSNENTFIYNTPKSEERFSPASTFKIPNTLIALEEGAIKDQNEIIRWDGKDKGREIWNRDHSLVTAFPASCVWFYQELARRIGNDKYKTYLKRFSYGNQQCNSPDLITFWLIGDLKISAKEQIIFLKKIYENKIPCKKSNIDILKNIMIVEEKPSFIIRAKTGTNQNIAWYVGYVETSNKVWFFAMNIEIKKKGDEEFRKEITMEALKLKGII